MTKQLSIAIVLLGSLAWQSCDEETAPAPVNCSDDPVTLTLLSSEDAKCSLADGRIEVTASGGSGPYQFQLGTASAKSTGVFESLGAGTYQITAVDKNSCSATLEVSVKNEDGLNVTFEATNAGCDASQGTLSVTAVDGTEPYQYKLDAGAFGATNTFSNLAKGNHNLIVKDASGCEVTQTVRLTSGISFAAAIAPIIQGNCAVSGCHNGTQAPDFRVFKNIQDNASQIKVLTGNGTMPQQGTLTQSQITMIACWVDDGAPSN